METTRKDLKRQKEEYENKIKELNKKQNSLGTSVENTKSDMIYQEKLKKQLDNDKDFMEKEKENANRKI